MKKTNIITVILLLVYYDTLDAFIPDDVGDQPKKPEICYGTDEVMDAKCCLFPPFFVREIARECGAIFALKYRSFEHNITTFRREAMTVGTPKEEAKSLAMLLKSVYEKAIRGIRNRTKAENDVINISIYRTNETHTRKKKKIHSRKRRHKPIKYHRSPPNLTIPKNRTSRQKQSSIQIHTSSSNHQSSQNQNQSSQSYLSDNSWVCILQRYHLLNEDNTLNMDRYHVHLDKWIELNPAFYAAVHEARTKCKYRFHMYLPLKAEEYFTFQTCIRTYVNIHCPHMIKSPLCDQQKKFYEKCSQYFFK